MKLVENIQSIYKRISDLKENSRDCLTNFYPNEEKLDYWIKKSILFTKNTKDTVFYFRKDRDFFHLYFYSRNKLDLEQELKIINSELTDIFIVDYIGNESNINIMVDVLEQCGFHKYIMYKRMKKFINANEILPDVNQDISYADLEDAPIIFSMFENNFDRFAEQLPTIDELEIAIRNREIIVLKDAINIAGILIRKMTPKSSLWMFFLVNKEYRNKKIGSKLLSFYFNECKDKRITMMVLANNYNAINIYKHYGFDFDGIVDQIMTNKNIQYEPRNN